MRRSAGFSSGEYGGKRSKVISSGIFRNDARCVLLLLHRYWVRFRCCGTPFSEQWPLPSWGGLTFVTVLTLIVLPVLFCTLFGITEEHTTESLQDMAVSSSEDDGIIPKTAAQRQAPEQELKTRTVNSCRHYELYSNDPCCQLRD